MQWKLPLHPFLVALVPVLSMYAAQVGLGPPAELFVAIVIALLVTGLLLTVTTLVFRSAERAALLVSAFLVLVVASDRLLSAAKPWSVYGHPLDLHRGALLVSYAAIAALAVYLYRTRAALAILSAVVTLAAAGAAAVPALTLLAFHFSTSARAHVQPVAAPDPVGSRKPDPLPDIYYIICDRYADTDTLRTLYGHDNQDFLRDLTAAGFFVARDSRSNYLKTGLSLASSLNLTLLDSVGSTQGPESRDWGPIHQMLRNHALGRFLRTQGYTYIHFGGSWWPTGRNPNASTNINYYSTVPRPLMLLLDAEFLRPAQKRLATSYLDERRQKWDRTNRQLSDLVALARDPAPTFAFVHLFITHDPYVFHRDGSFLPREEEEGRSERDIYVDQVAAASAKIRAAIDRILTDSPTPPVIVLQSDEGHYPRGTHAATFDWRQASPAQLREKSGILNAYYLPGGHADVLYDQITPVNSFRIVLNTYFGTSLALLADRTYAHRSDEHPYQFEDVTSAVRSAR
jgi:hypothetical protein